MGYMGRRGYHIYDPRHDNVFEVRDIVFEEGTVHRTRDADSDDIVFQPTMPVRVASPDVSLSGVTSLPSTPTSSPPPSCPPSPPPTPRRSTRVAKPSEQALKMIAAERAEMEARLAGEDWARDSV